MSVIWSSDQDIGRITFALEEPCYALSGADFRAFSEIVNGLGTTPRERVVLIESATPVFGTGADVRDMFGAEGAVGVHLPEVLDAFNQALTRLYTCPAIVVAAVQGAAIGCSLGIVHAADWVVAARGTRFSTGYGRIGASADAGNSWILPRLMGYRRALEWLLFSEIMTAEEAHEHGLVNTVVPIEQLPDVVEKLLARLRHGPHEAILRMKHLVRQGMNNSLAEQLELEKATLLAQTACPEFAEGMRAFLEKRTPHFSECCER